MDVRADLAALAEIAGQAQSPAEYDRELLSLLDQRLGFDVGMVIRTEGPSEGARGLDPGVRRRCGPRWGGFVEEAAEWVAAASRSGGVAVDLEVLGAQRLERTAFYQELMRPHGGRTTALLVLPWRGQVAGTVSVGRCSPGFREPELAYLRALVPTLALGEVALLAAPPAPLELRAAASRLTPREREVLGYLRLGYTNEQIARACGNSPRTVRNQLSRVFATLGVSSRAEAVSVALSLGLSP